MKRITPEQAYGVGLRITQALSVAKVTKESVQLALGSNQLGEAVIEVIRFGPEEALRRLWGGQQVYPITVDYHLSLEQMIAAGCYDWVNSDITSKHFPVKGTGTVELDGQLIHYGRNMSSEAVLADLDQRGLRPATMAELLAFGAKYPELQRQFPIVELGSVWQNPFGFRSVGVLVRGGRERLLRLCWFEGDWGALYRFLAFRK